MISAEILVFPHEIIGHSLEMTQSHLHVNIELSGQELQLKLFPMEKA